MILISLYTALATKGLTMDLLLVLILLGLFVALYRVARLLRRRVPEPLHRLEEWLDTSTAQMSLRIAFALGMAFIALAETLGIEVILGAFLGGAIIALLAPEEGSELRKVGCLWLWLFHPHLFHPCG